MWYLLASPAPGRSCLLARCGVPIPSFPLHSQPGACPPGPVTEPSHHTACLGRMKTPASLGIVHVHACFSLSFQTSSGSLCLTKEILTDRRESMGEPNKGLLAGEFPHRPLRPQNTGPWSRSAYEHSLCKGVPRTPLSQSLRMLWFHPGSQQVAEGCIRHSGALHALDGSLMQS